MSEKKLSAAIGLYVLIAVLCFGPAMVQSERARDEHQRQCKAERAHDAEAQKWCALFGPSTGDAFPKALAWPLWLSYMGARAATTKGASHGN